MARCTIGNRDVSLLMTILGINVYSATAIMAEIGDIKPFERKEKLALYKGPYNKAWPFNDKIHTCNNSTLPNKIFKEDEDEISEHGQKAGKENGNGCNCKNIDGMHLHNVFQSGKIQRSD